MIRKLKWQDVLWPCVIALTTFILYRLFVAYRDPIDMRVASIDETNIQITLNYLGRKTGSDLYISYTNLEGKEVTCLTMSGFQFDEVDVSDMRPIIWDWIIPKNMDATKPVTVMKQKYANSEFFVVKGKTEYEVELLFGDIDGDGKIDDVDMKLMRSAVSMAAKGSASNDVVESGLSNLNNDSNFVLVGMCDLNGDGDVNFVDEAIVTASALKNKVR